jgi:PAS domain S-box-containing protein
MDLRFTRLDGSSVWAILEGTPIYDTEGRYDGSLAMVMDVSERRHAEVALRASEARFRRLWEAGILLITIWDSTGKIGEINDAGVRMLGYSRKELLEGGFGWEDITPKKWRAVDEAARAQLLATGVASPWEKELRCKDGSRVPILAAAAVLADGEGIAIAIDMTERKAVEAALRDTEREYREIVEATTDGIAKIDEDGLIAFVNPRLAEMFGYVPSELIGRGAADPIASFGKPEGEDAIAWTRGGRAAAFDSTFQHRDGTDISVHVARSPLRDDAGRPVGSLVVVRDVTERRRLQAQLMISDRMASVGTLAAGVAHEINNPLTSVIANLDYIAESLRPGAGSDARASGIRSQSLLGEEITSSLNDAREAAQRVRLIVRDLKAFSRSPGDEHMGSVDVQTTLESSLRMAWNEIRHRARLVKDYGEVPGVAAHEGRLGQVFLNLIVNAAQSIPEGRAEHNEIRVSTRLEGERVLIEVADTGVGIPPHAIGRIFDAFYTTKPVGLGTGLGLAICQRIVMDVGGELTVRSEVGVGTTFRVALPVGREDDEMDGAASSEEAVVAGRRGHILVVDDEIAILRSVKRLLAKEHDVVIASSAGEALALCTGGTSFDLLLCDLMMPDMTGMDLHRELTLTAPDQAERMIFLTGGAFTPNARDFLSASPKELIEKPFDAANLRAVVRRYVSGIRSEAS